MSEDIALVQVATGVYMEQQDPLTVMIVPEEILKANEMEPSDELLAATYAALATEYEKAGYEPRRLKEPEGGADADS